MVDKNKTFCDDSDTTKLPQRELIFTDSRKARRSYSNVGRRCDGHDSGGI